MPIRRRGSLARRHPERRVEPPIIVPGAFEEQVQAALDRLPPEFAVLLDSVAVVVEDVPTPDQARDADGDADGWLYGIYDGTPLNAWGADQVPFPNVITLFRVRSRRTSPIPTSWPGRISAPWSTSWRTTPASMTPGSRSWATTEPGTRAASAAGPGPRCRRTR